MFLLMIVAVVVAVGLTGWLIWTDRGPVSLPEMSERQLVTEALLQRLHEDAVWSELHRRLRTGELSDEAADRSVMVLVDQLPTMGWDRWRDALDKAQPYINDLLESGKMTPLTSLAFHRAFFSKPPRILPFNEVYASLGRLRVDVQAGNAWRFSPHLRYGMVFNVTGVALNGQPFEPDSVRHSADLWTGKTRGEIATGRHRVVVQVRAALTDRSLANRNTQALPLDDWPPTVVEWNTEAAAEWQVLPPGQEREP